MPTIAPRSRTCFVASVIASLALAACQAANETTSPGALPSNTASPTLVQSLDSTPAPEETPSAQVKPDDLVATTVDGLRVRRTPGTEGEQIGFLALGTVGFVMAEPVEIASVPWYPLSGMGLPYGTGCLAPVPDEPLSCPGWKGWVAGTSAAGDPWLQAVAAPACPGPRPTIEQITEYAPALRLVCWSGQELSFRAWWPLIPQDAGLGGLCMESELQAGWLLCQNINYNGVAATEAEGFATRLALSIDPDSGVTMPERGQFVDVTGHFDDPAARLCAEGAETMDADPISLVFECRIQFVPTSVMVASGS